MKKVITIIAAFAIFSMSASAQSSFLNKLKGAATQAIGGVVNTVTGGTATTPEGNWTYNGVAVQLTTDSMLGDIASSAVVGNIEAKMDEFLSKIGIKSGVATLTFSNDSTFTINAGVVKLAGQWSQSGEKVSMNFGKNMTFLKLEGTFKSITDGCEIVFPADKFITFAEKAAEVASSITGKTSDSNVLSSLMSNVKGVNAGFKMKKQE